MGFIESIRLAFASLSANKMRSFLTMLGIIIGISAVITITTIGNSIQQTLKNTFNQINVNFMFVMLSSKPLPDGESEDDRRITEDDAFSFEKLCGLLEAYPDEFKLILENSLGKGEIVNAKNEYITVNISGATDGCLEQSKIDIIEGRNITLRDNIEMKHTMVVSDIFANQYFGGVSKAVGKTVSFSINDEENQEFVITGVYEYSEVKLGKFPVGIKESEKVTPAYIPYQTVNKLKDNLNDTYAYFDVMWTDKVDSKTAEAHVYEYFNQYYEHNKYWEIYVENEQSIFNMINTVLNIVTVAISVIAAISLLVGGVGVMNIMLVSIIERTREIGVRKALGAQNSSIRLQFVVEAIIICLIGGIIGILTGILNGVIIGKVVSTLVTSMYAEYMDIIVVSISPSISAIAISVIFSMLTGVFFGYYPANKAAKMNPIDALRYD